MKRHKLMIILIILNILSISASAASLNGQYEEMTGFTSKPGILGEVKLALIDTGIDSELIDKAKILPGINYVSGNNGDMVGHGTAIASLIAGAANEKEYISSLAPNAMLIPIVYYSKYPSGVAVNGGIEAICKGIYDAIDKFDAAIIVISSGILSDNTELRKAIAYAEKMDVIVISAVGNDGGSEAFYPAAYESVISTACVDKNKNISLFSQKNVSVKVAAPGEALYAAQTGTRQFKPVSGSSYACAYAAAMAAVLKGCYPEMTASDFRAIVRYTSCDIESIGYDKSSGYGLINLQNALRYSKKLLGRDEAACTCGTCDRLTARMHTKIAELSKRLSDKFGYLE